LTYLSAFADPNLNGDLLLDLLDEGVFDVDLLTPGIPNVGVVTVDLFPLDKKLVDLLRVGGINLSKDPARLFLALLQEASFELVLYKEELGF
jgi:hypothetical protein